MYIFFSCATEYIYASKSDPRTRDRIYTIGVEIFGDVKNGAKGGRSETSMREMSIHR
jgi:hypothetical protein